MKLDLKQVNNEDSEESLSHVEPRSLEITDQATSKVG